MECAKAMHVHCSIKQYDRGVNSCIVLWGSVLGLDLGGAYWGLTWCALSN